MYEGEWDYAIMIDDVSLSKLQTMKSYLIMLLMEDGGLPMQHLVVMDLISHLIL